MNPHTIRRLFPHASASLLAANAHDYGRAHDHDHDHRRPAPRLPPQHHPHHPEPDHDAPQTHRALPHAEPQRDQAPALDAAAPRATAGDGRAVVRFTGYRVRPLDPDNFAGSIKDLLDGLCRARLLPGDEPWRIRLETEQVRVRHFAEEKTEIDLALPTLAP